MNEWLIIAVVALLGMEVAYVHMAVTRISHTVEVINWKLSLLSKHSGVNLLQDLPAKVVEEVQAILREGPSRKIQAIKRYRELTGAGLAAAKHAVERIQEDARSA
jgi:ribosomal protein L7/L12